MRRPIALVLLAAWAFALVWLLGSGGAEARTEGRSDYTKAQTYSGALRYLRVDLGYEITERDPDAAYLLFKYVPAGRKAPSNGSIEIVESKGAVKVLVQLPQMPAYHEQALRDGLMKKLLAEYGAPPKRDDKDKGKKKPDPGDAGADGDSDGDQRDVAP